MATQNLTREADRNQKKGIRNFSAILDYADTINTPINTSADIYELFELPPESVILRADIYVLTASDAATSAVANLGFDGDDTLIDGADLTSAADSTLNGGTNAVVPILKPTGGTVTFLPTYTGATTEGRFLVMVDYLEYTKTEQGEITNFSNTA